jgi:hypothetical protein
MTRPSISPALLAFALAAGCVCNADGAARDLAGDGATNCGFATTAEERAIVIECAEAELEAGRPFFMGYRRAGRDSEVRTYLAADDEGVWILGYDGGLSGDRPHLVAMRCSSPPARTSTTIDGELLTCPGDPTTSVTICSR